MTTNTPGTQRSSLAPSSLRTRSRRRQAILKAAVEPLEQRQLFSFSPAASYGVSGAPQALVTADFNGDGRLDVATANSTGGTVSVLLGSATGTLQPAASYAAGAAPRSLAVGDFNSDGKPDLVTANADNLSVLLNNGAGGFQAPAGVVLPATPLSVAVGDINADGKLDLAATWKSVVPGSSSGYYYYPAHDASGATVLLGNGSGSFTTGGSTSLK
jgi:hypothetical protein